MMSIKGIIFDWAGVFCSAGEPFSHPLLTSTLDLTVEELGNLTQDIQREYYSGKISTTEFWNNIIKFFKLENISPTDLSNAYLGSYKIYPEMLRLAANLKKKYKTVLLSNLTSEMVEDIKKKFNVCDYFHHTLFSNEIGYLKPDPMAFKIARQKLGLESKNTLFIDDSTTNTNAANKLGYQTLLFKTPSELIRDLNTLGILV